MLLVYPHQLPAQRRNPPELSCKLNSRWTTNRVMYVFLPLDCSGLMTRKSTLPTEDDVATWLAEHGDFLYRFALKRLGSQEVAEDLVQDTFVAALRSLKDFQGRSAVQTWLIGILKHKITDHFRKVSRQRQREANDSEAVIDLFHGGHWKTSLGAWPMDPVRSLENKEFWRELAACQDKLPAKLAAAFRMREVEDMSMSDICEVLDISASNLSVRLHRARLLLRECLDRNWFAAGRMT